MRKGIAYVRESTKKQDEKNIAPQVQIESIGKYADKEKIEIMKEIRVAESARKIGRSGFGKLMKLAKENLWDILVYNEDRLHRIHADKDLIWKLKYKYDIDIHFTKDEKILKLDPNSKLVNNIIISTKEYEIDVLSERVTDALKIIAKSGRYPHISPTGYLNERKSENETKIIEDKRTSEGVKLAFKLRAEEVPFDSIVEILNDAGHKVRTITGKLRSYRRNTLQGILSSRFYIGFFQWSGEEYSNQDKNGNPTYPQFIENELFDRVQKINKIKKHERNGVDKERFLALLLRCGICGTHIIPRNGGNGKKTYKYYGCTYTKSPKGIRKQCGQGLWNYQIVNEEFGNRIINTISYVTDKDIVNSVMEGLKKERVEQDTTLNLKVKKEKEIKAAIERENELLFDQQLELEKMKNGEKFLERTVKKFNENCERINRSKERIDKLINSKHDYITETKQLFSLLKNITKTYSKGNAKEKLEILSCMISHIELFGKNKEAKIHWNAPSFETLFEIGKLFVTQPTKQWRMALKI